MVSHSLADLAKVLGGALEGPGDVTVEAVGDPAASAVGEIIVWREETPVPADAAASAVVARHGVDCGGRPVIRVESPRLALALLLAVLHPEPQPEPGIHETAVIDPEADIAPDVHVGAHATIGRARIGAGTVVGASCFVDDGVSVGAGCRLFPRVVLIEGTRLGDRVRIHAGSVLGADGFGYEPQPTGLAKVPQRGGVEIGDDVEIGALTAIDRSTLPGSFTRVGAGTKIDNLVQIAHNVQVGRCCFICACCGIAGSTTVGDGAVLGGQVGVRDHVTIGAGAQLAGASAVYGNVPEGATYGGWPARPHRQFLYIEASLRRVPDLLKTVKALEKRVAELEADAQARGTPDA